MEKYWHEFEDSEENKLCYMDIFKEYVRMRIYFLKLKCTSFELQEMVFW
jgi:hypothetical protein